MDGTASVLNTVLYGTDTTFSDVSPGVFFFYTRITLGAGSHTVEVVQTRNNAQANLTIPIQGNQAYVFDLSCNRVVTLGSDGKSPPNVSGPGTFIIGVKYAPNELTGALPAGNATVHYDLRVKVDGADVGSAADPDGLNLAPKP